MLTDHQTEKLIACVEEELREMEEYKGVSSSRVDALQVEEFLVRITVFETVMTKKNKINTLYTGNNDAG